MRDVHLVQRGDVQQRSGELRKGHALGLQRQQEPLDAERPADAGNGLLAAEFLRQPAVAPPSAQRGLRADTLVVQLPRGAAVVVQAAHDARVDVVLDAPLGQVGLHGAEVRARILTQEVQHGLHGEFRQELLIGGALAVQDTHGVAGQAVLRVVRQALQLRREQLPQVGVVALAVLRVADAAQLHAHARESQFADHAHHQRDGLGVHQRVRAAQHLVIHLMELPQAPPLLPLGAEHRPVRPQLQRRRQLLQPVLQVRAHDRRCALGPQDVPTVIPEVIHGEHLLADDVRAAPHATLHEVRLLEQGRVDALRARAFQNAPCLLHQPAVRLRRNVKREFRTQCRQVILSALGAVDRHNPSSIAPARQNPHPPECPCRRTAPGARQGRGRPPETRTAAPSEPRLTA